MIMQDFVTPEERLNFNDAKEVSIGDFYNFDCCGCGRNSAEIVKEDDCTFEQLDEYSVTTNGGLWYCHQDCFRDSQ